MSIRTLHVGLGPIGAAVARQAASRPGLLPVGGVDLDPSKVDRDLGAVIGLDQVLDANVFSDIGAAIEATRPDIAVLCTSSALPKVFGALEALLKGKVPVVSTTEEMSFPTAENQQVAAKIHALALEAGVAVLGTGVNPGFVMDSLPIALTSVCEHIDALEIDRIQDASIRRLPFQQKIGAGLTVVEFQERVAAGSVRHVGLAESVSMIADALGWTLDRITDQIGPKVAELEVSSQHITVQPGFVCGMVQDGVGYVDGSPLIKLHMEAYLGAPESYDRVRVHGSPPLDMKLAGGVQGDIATASIVINSIPRVLAAAPGLKTMKDLPLPSYFPG